VVEPESRVVEPESRVVEPESRVVEPESRVVEPESRVVEPESRVVEPVETTPAPEPGDLDKLDQPGVELDQPGVELDQPEGPPEPVVEPVARPEEPRDEASRRETTPGETGQPRAGTGTSSGLSLVDVRRLWPDLLDMVKLKRRFTWILLSQNAQVAAVDDTTLTIALVNAGARNSFSSGGSEEILRQAAIDVIGHDWRIEAIVDPSAQPGTEPAIQVTRPAVPADRPTEAPAPAPEAPPRVQADPESVASARGAIQETRPKGEGRAARSSLSDDDADRDDPDADDHTLGGAQLLERELGASIIEEIKHD
jgi:DNA polymerase-3 subunit gamma/tau